MERNRVSRKGTSSVIDETFSFSRRRSRNSIALRDSSGVCEDDESDSVKDRSNEKKERTNKRRRLSSNGKYHVDDECGSSDESLNGYHNDGDDRHVVTGGERPKHPELKRLDEMLGVSVPRRTRSASVKRLNDSFSIVRQFSCPLPNTTSAASPSPPSSNVSTKATRKMVKSMAKAKPSKTSKVTISESEVEVAEFLFGLTRLQSSAKSDTFKSPSQVLHKHNSSNEALVLAKISLPMSTPVSPPSTQLSVLLQNSSFMTTSVTIPKRKKPRALQLEDDYDDDDSRMMACTSKPIVCGNHGISSNSSIPASSPETEGILGSPAAKPVVLSPKPDKNVPSNEEPTSKPETSLPMSSPPPTSFQEILPLTEEIPSDKSSSESKTSVSLEKNLQTADSPKVEETRALQVNLQSSVHVAEKESSAMEQDTSALLISDVNLDTPSSTSPGSVVAEETRMVKFEIDLMAPPKNDGDVLDEVGTTSAAQTSNLEMLYPVIGKANSQTEVNINSQRQVEAAEARPKHNDTVLDLEQNMQLKETLKVPAMEKQLYNEKKKGSSNDDQNQLDKNNNKQPSQKLLTNSARPTDRTGLPVGIMASTSNPLSITVPSWPGLSQYGYLGSSPANLSGLPAVQTSVPKEGNCAIPNPPLMMLPHARPSHCATHCFIAQNILLHQQAARLKPIWHAAGSAALCGGKPYNLNMLPPSESILLSAGSLVKNPNMVPNGNVGPGSVMSLNGYNPAGQIPYSYTDNQGKPYQLPQSALQMPSFNFPFNQSRTSGIKSSHGVENASSVSASSGSVAATSGSVNPKFSNIAAKSDPQYITMLHSGYPFPLPAYRAHMSQQQQPGAPLFGGSLYAANLLQFHAHMLPHLHNQSHSTPSMSSSKSPAESCRNEAEPVQDREGGSGLRVQPIAKEVLGHVTGVPNFHQSFSVLPLSFNGNQPQQQPGEPNVHMSLKGMESTSGSFSSAHSMLQAMPSFGLQQYRMGGGNIPIQTVNKSKASSKSASGTGTDKFLEPSHGQSLPVSNRQQRQKQIVARTQVLDSSVSSGGSSGLDPTDRILVDYSKAGANFPANTMGFPQWKMPPSERAAPGALPGKFVQSGMAVTVAVAAVTQNDGSSTVKASMGISSPMNSTLLAPSSGPSVMTLSDQARSQPKTQQLYFSSESTHQHPGSSSSLSSQRHPPEMNSERQAMFPDALNLRRPANQQAQPSPTVGYQGAGKYPEVFGQPLAGSSVAVMAAASYAQPAANLSVKSAEQKPAAA